MDVDRCQQWMILVTDYKHILWCVQSIPLIYVYKVPYFPVGHKIVSI